MNDQYWSWLLTAVGLTGFVLAGRKVWWCWYINIGCQALWLTYALVTKQYGFIVASLAYTYVFTKNAIKWTKEHKAEQKRLDAMIFHNPKYDQEMAYLQEYAEKDVELTNRLYDHDSDDLRG